MIYAPVERSPTQSAVHHGLAGNAVVGNGILEPGMQIIIKPFAIDALGDKIRKMLDT
jgi:hypothetical protein